MDTTAGSLGLINASAPVEQDGEESVDVTVQRHTGKHLGEWMVKMNGARHLDGAGLGICSKVPPRLHKQHNKVLFFFRRNLLGEEEIVEFSPIKTS